MSVSIECHICYANSFEIVNLSTVCEYEGHWHTQNSKESTWKIYALYFEVHLVLLTY
jgi:hypothetical protein